MKPSDVSELQEDSFFKLYRLPEQTRALEATASLIRSLLDCSEAEGLASSKQFSSKIYDPEPNKKIPELDGCPQDWIGQILLAKGLEVPPSEREVPAKAGSVLTLVPLTPSIARHSCFTRKSGNAWNPGAYVVGMLRKGASTVEAAADLLARLAEAFAVVNNDSSHRTDAWATLVETAALAITGDEPWSGEISFERLSAMDGWAEYPGKWVTELDAYPAGSFFRDIERIISLERLVTRRTWIGIVDCFVRLATSSDMLWVGRMNQALADMISQAAQQSDPSKLHRDWVIKFFQDSFRPLVIGGHCENILRQEVREFAKAQLLVSAYIDLLPKDVMDSVRNVGGLSTIEGLVLMAKAAQRLPSNLLDEARSTRSQVIDENPNMMSLKGQKTWTQQLYFALRYGLGQRSARSEANRHFDQGYWCRKSGPARSQSWHFEMSPIGIFLMVHLVTADGEMATARDLQDKLGEYGIGVSMADISRGPIGSSLRSLGLVTDSPDAEGGMVLRSPFPHWRSA